MKRLLPRVGPPFLLIALAVGLLPGTHIVNISAESPFAQATPHNQGETQEWDPERDGIGDLTEGPRFAIAPDRRSSLTIVGQRFSQGEFARYVRDNVAGQLKKDRHWRPTLIVLHNTWKPTIAMRPNGFTASNMSGLAYYYGVKMGWSAGPHLFVDQNGIWVFSPLIATGRHSPSWNHVSWGIEQLGDFVTEEYQSGDGAKIRDNANAAMAILSIGGNIDIEKQLRLHKEDRLTTHKTCPGDRVQKSAVIADVKREISKWRADWNR